MKKVSLEELKERIKTRYPEEEFLVIEYDSLGKPGKLQCKKCENIIELSKISNFFVKTKRYGCVNCHGLWREREKTLNQIKEKYEILSTEVKNTHTFYTIKCKECGHIRKDTLSNFKRHLLCGCKTGVKRNRSSQEFLETINKNCIEGSYTLLSQYKNQTEKVLLKHSCGFEWEVRPSDVLNGRSFCPRCGKKESIGEKKIRKFLELKNIEFQQEKKLNNSLQRFDFYLENKKIKIAIEFNGKQHYEEVEKFHDTLAQRQANDLKKQNYCKENNILLYIIPYYYDDDEIYKTLETIIKKFNDYPEKE
mgnify:CR=1 FL=1